ncbi:MAG: peptidylprolyl isomerase FKBP-type [Frankiales bacterium]|nr:peptidylprolyl isomerase FKBP-type [Frankiales bacterium]
MRRTVALVVTALLLSGCAGGTKSPSQSAGPFTVVGSFGTEPQITFPSGGPPKDLVKQVTTEGTGPAVVKGDVLVAQYVGQIWDGAVFDNKTFANKSPTTFPIGVGRVVPGWDKELVGVKAGSRVLLSLPPAEGYGTAGQTQANIKGTDTIVFVVDVIAAYLPTQPPPTGAVAEPSADTQGVTVTGDVGAAPKLTVAKNSPPPTAVKTVVLARGTGPALKPGFVMYQAESVDWSGAPAGSTWTDSGIDGSAIGNGGPLDALVGLPVGSRVLLLLPKTEGATGNPAIAATLDIVAEPWLAK